MIPRALALLVLLLAPVAADDDDAPLPADPSVAAHVLASARKELKNSRTELKGLSPDERGVVAKARDATAETAKWKALAPSLGAAADLLERAGEGTGATPELCAYMARSFRAMAEEVDKDASYLTDEQKEQAPGKRADTTADAADKLLAAAADAAMDDAVTESWQIMTRTDPRYRALALNVKTLARGFATLSATEHEKAPGEAIAKAAKLQEALEPWFAGVNTSRRAEAPQPEAPPPPVKRYRIKVRVQ